MLLLLLLLLLFMMLALLLAVIHGCFLCHFRFGSSQRPRKSHSPPAQSHYQYRISCPDLTVLCVVRLVLLLPLLLLLSLNIATALCAHVSVRFSNCTIATLRGFHR